MFPRLENWMGCGGQGMGWGCKGGEALVKIERRS
jgi:hypothetical protein